MCVLLKSVYVHIPFKPDRSNPCHTFLQYPLTKIVYLKAFPIPADKPMPCLVYQLN